MPTAPTHAVAALALGAWYHRHGAPRRLLATGALVAALPDADVLGFRFGIQYGDLLGHRGLTHSLCFAAVSAAIVVALWYRRGAGRLTAIAAWSYLALAMASHGVLDAFTDGGLGIGFFSPLDPTRYFWPFRPIAVAPIGVRGLFRPSIMPVLRTELVWVWLPAALIAAAAWIRPPRRDGRQVAPAS